MNIYLDTDADYYKLGADLVAGDKFSLNGEVGTFVMWSGRPFRTSLGSLRRMAVIRTGDNSDGVRWSISQQGHVRILEGRISSRS